MQNNFVTYEIALKLKELGFDEECLAFSYIDKQTRWYFEEWNKLSISNFGFIRNSIIDEYGTFEEDESGNIEEIVAIPLYSQVIDWFMKVYELHIQIIVNYDQSTQTRSYRVGIIYITQLSDTKFLQTMFIRPENDEINFVEFTSYEEAREQAILKAIELIKSKKYVVPILCSISYT